MVAHVLRMKEAVRAWLAARPKTFFFSEGTKKFVQRWKKCIEKQGDYVEKWCYYKFYIFIEIKFVSVVRLIIDSLTYNTIHGRIFLFNDCVPNNNVIYLNRY